MFIKRNNVVVNLNNISSFLICEWENEKRMISFISLLNQSIMNFKFEDEVRCQIAFEIIVTHLCSDVSIIHLEDVMINQFLKKK